MGMRRISAGILLPIIGILSIVIIGLSGTAYQTSFDPAKILKENAASQNLLVAAVPSATLAIAAVFSGAFYAFGKTESWVTAAVALSTAWVAWAFCLVAFGFACKQSELGSHYKEELGIELGGGLKALAGVTILVFLLETVYVILLHLTIGRSAD